MRMGDGQAEREAACSEERGESLGDIRFRALLSDADWRALPLAIRRRFSKCLAGGKSAVYIGEVLETRMSMAGWLLAQTLRLFGGPLPTSREARLPCVVTVTEDLGGGGQIWTRLYTRRSGFPQVIHSAKRFSGSTGLEEHVGLGLGMALEVSVRGAALVFRSRSYFFQAAGRQVVLPSWATPGTLTVTHAEAGNEHFVFTLEIKHPRFGMLVRHAARFQEARP